MNEVKELESDCLDFLIIKEYNKNLQDFFTRLGITVYKNFKKNELESDTALEETTKERQSIRFFEVKTKDQPIYRKLTSKGMLKEIFEEVIFHKENLLEKLVSMLDENQLTLDEGVKEQIGMHIRNLDRFGKTFESRVKKLDIDSVVDVGEMQYKLYKFLSDIIKDYYISRIIPSLFEAMKVDKSNTFRIILGHVNQFLSELGIKTHVILEGELMKYELYEPTLDSSEQITEDINLKDKIKNMEQFAYIFNEEDEEAYIVSTGKARVWRYSL